MNNIKYRYIKLNDSIKEKYNFSLFCLNREAFNYSYLSFYKAKIVMEYLFPIPTPYEIVDYNLANISFNVVYSMNKRLILSFTLYENLFNKIYYFQKLLLLLIFFLFLKFIYNFNFYRNNNYISLD